MFETSIYLRCDQDHPNTVPMSERVSRVGQRCSRCGHPLLAEVPRERPPFRGARY